MENAPAPQWEQTVAEAESLGYNIHKRVGPKWVILYRPAVGLAVVIQVGHLVKVRLTWESKKVACSLQATIKAAFEKVADSVVEVA